MTTNDKPAGMPISRRRLLQGGALMGVAAFLAACGTKGTTASAAPSSAAPAAPSTAASEAPSATASGSPAASGSAAPSAPAESMIPAGTVTDVVWANWPLYIDVDHGKHPSIQAFEKKYSVKVTYKEAVNDNTEFLGKIQPNLQNNQPTGWDIITMTDWMAAKLIRLGWMQRFDPAAMPNFQANIKDTYKSADWDPDVAHHAPWQSGMTGMGFDPAVTGDLTSLKALYTADPRWTGKVDFLSEMRDAIGLTMLSLGLDPTKPTRDACDQAVAAIKAAKDAGIIRAFRGNDYAQDLSGGDAVLVQAWSGDMVQVLADKPGLKFVVADEGGLLWTDNMMIPKGAAHAYTAELLIDFYYTPEIAAMVEAYVNYICPVKGADEVLKKTNPDVANNPLIFPPDALLAQCRIFGALSPDDEKYFNDQFAKVSGKG